MCAFAHLPDRVAQDKVQPGGDGWVHAKFKNRKGLEARMGVVDCGIATFTWLVLGSSRS